MRRGGPPRRRGAWTTARAPRPSRSSPSAPLGPRGSPRRALRRERGESGRGPRGSFGGHGHLMRAGARGGVERAPGPFRGASVAFLPDRRIDRSRGPTCHRREGEEQEGLPGFHHGSRRRQGAVAIDAGVPWARLMRDVPRGLRPRATRPAPGCPRGAQENGPAPGGSRSGLPAPSSGPAARPGAAAAPLNTTSVYRDPVLDYINRTTGESRAIPSLSSGPALENAGFIGNGGGGLRVVEDDFFIPERPTEACVALLCAARGPSLRQRQAAPRCAIPPFRGRLPGKSRFIPR